MKRKSGQDRQVDRTFNLLVRGDGSAGLGDKFRTGVQIMFMEFAR